MGKYKIENFCFKFLCVNIISVRDSFEDTSECWCLSWSLENLPVEICSAYLWAVQTIIDTDGFRKAMPAFSLALIGGRAKSIIPGTFSQLQTMDSNYQKTNFTLQTVT